MGKVEKRKVGGDEHEEVKLVHEVKMEVYSRDEARLAKSSAVYWFHYRSTRIHG